MGFDPNKFIQEQKSNGKTHEEACFLLGFRACIDCIEDLEKKGVIETYVNITDELELTFSKLLDRK